MNKKLVFGALLGAAIMYGPVRAADQGHDAAADAMMQACVQAGTPGAPHQALAAMSGTWEATVKTWMDPSQPPMESTGVAEFSMELGGRYLLQKFRGTMMGQPYEGLGHTGYDNVQKKYVSTWLDNMSTGIMMSTGTEDPATKKMTYTGSFWEPMSGREMKVDQALSMAGPDRCIFEMYMPGPDGKMVKNMEITYNRRK
jgi:hypothetical protein